MIDTAGSIYKTVFLSNSGKFCRNFKFRHCPNIQNIQRDILVEHHNPYKHKPTGIM